MKANSPKPNSVTLSEFWKGTALTPRQLRRCDPSQLSLDEARALSVHAWLCAPAGWKEAVLKRVSELLQQQANQPKGNQ